MPKREEITDIVNDLKARYTPENFKALGIKKGKVLRFDYEGSPVTLRITRVAKDRYWAEHVELVDQKIVKSHYGHNVDATQTPPWCEDCEVPVDELSTEDGDKKAKDRDERTLSDGTEINSDAS